MGKKGVENRRRGGGEVIYGTRRVDRNNREMVGGNPGRKGGGNMIWDKGVSGNRGERGWEPGRKGGGNMKWDKEV